mmetsp:Transcript_16935/g.23862  ORF Transcript_16935/g.23862 Transcript_16935/m.23862 type:complete len:246 (-) Transcript_16935:199-936(-)
MQKSSTAEKYSHFGLFVCVCSSSSTICLGLSKRLELLGFFNSHSLLTLIKLGLSLETHDSTTPLAHQVSIIIELFLGKILQKVELSRIFLGHTRQGNTGSSLQVDKSTKTSLILDNHKGNIHLTAQGRHPKDKFYGVDITGNQDKFSLLFFNQGGHVLQTVLDLVGSLFSRVLATGGSSSGILDALLLGRRGFGTVLVQQGKDSHGFILANGLGKLVNGRRNLQTLVQDSTLTLKTNVLGPTDET